jgi:putative tRNA adenosine deaminase-associated protein
VSYFAAAAVRDSSGWSAAEISLTDIADLEDVADRLREVEPAADVSLLFVESDDVYLAILRLDKGEDLRVFTSDAAFADDSRLGAILLGDLGGADVDMAVAELEASVAADADTDVESDAMEGDGERRIGAGPGADADPAGDAGLLTDLGLGPKQLLDLCAQDGMLPSDITAEVCQAIGCGDEVEELREA